MIASDCWSRRGEGSVSESTSGEKRFGVVSALESAFLRVVLDSKTAASSVSEGGFGDSKDEAEEGCLVGRIRLSRLRIEDASGERREDEASKSGCVNAVPDDLVGGASGARRDCDCPMAGVAWVEDAESVVEAGEAQAR